VRQSLVGSQKTTSNVRRSLAGSQKTTSNVLKRSSP
jgi:hypothetical protein